MLRYCKLEFFNCRRAVTFLHLFHRVVIVSQSLLRNIRKLCIYHAWFSLTILKLQPDIQGEDLCRTSPELPDIYRCRISFVIRFFLNRNVVAAGRRPAKGKVAVLVSGEDPVATGHRREPDAHSTLEWSPRRSENGSDY